tara:strand:- start:196 stop:639 length:444 start_codon:yes stop_codon:yes gene_type:complete
MHDLTPKQKRKARITALQIIYAKEFNGSDMDTTFEHMLDFDDKLEDDVIIYSRHLYLLTIKHLHETDELIKKWSKNWDIERITIMDRLILRMSLAEMLYEDEVPPKVSITEGVEIAKQFSTSDSSSFINGILDAVYNNLLKRKEKTI